MDISVIVPLYYGNKYVYNIREMIKKNEVKLKENGKNVDVELIFINDSPDEKIIINEDERIQLYNNEFNMGVQRSRIEGLKHSTGKYVLFLDQDDTIAENYLLSQLECIGEADAVVCNGYYRRDKLIYDTTRNVEIKKNVFCYTRHVIISPGQVLIKRESIPQEWCIDILQHPGTDDYLLWVLMCANNATFLVNMKPLYTHVENGSNTFLHWKDMGDSLKEVISYVEGAGKLSRHELDQLISSAKISINKLNDYARLEEKWKIANRWNIVLTNYFNNKNIYEIAIYGYGVIGEMVVRELQEEGVEIKYLIDQDSALYRNPEYKIYNSAEVLPYVDLVIVTPLFAFEEIRLKLKAQNLGYVISLEEILDDLLGKVKKF